MNAYLQNLLGNIVNKNCVVVVDLYWIRSGPQDLSKSDPDSTYLGLKTQKTKNQFSHKLLKSLKLERTFAELVTWTLDSDA